MKKKTFDECGENCESCGGFCVFDGFMKDRLILSKRKITKKYVPPDISAIKLLGDMSTKENSFNELSDKEIEDEILNIMSFLKECKNE